MSWKWSHCLHYEEVWGSGVLTPIVFLNLAIDRGKLSVSRPGHFNPGEISLGVHWRRGLGGSGIGLNPFKDSKFLVPPPGIGIRFLERPARGDTILTELSRFIDIEYIFIPGLKLESITFSLKQSKLREEIICANKMPTRCNGGFYCRSYCLLNMFRAPLCPSSGAQEYYTVLAACGISCCGFQVVGLVWSWGLCVRFAGCCSILSERKVI